MARRDSKHRILRVGESIRSDGRYQFKYIVNGKAKFVYSWRLEPTDKTPLGRRPGPCLRDLEKEIGRIRAESLYVSNETYAHVHRGTIVSRDIHIDQMHIFPLPSSHTKGCLGLEVDETFAFVGDALYSKVKDDCYVYNAQLLCEEINVLSALRSPWLLVSHFPGMIRKCLDAFLRVPPSKVRADCSIHRPQQVPQR